MNPRRIVRVVLIGGLSGVFAGGASAQAPGPERPAGSCFEIIAPQRHAEPASPILFDRCTGKSWLLVRHDSGGRPARQSAYRWVSLAVEDVRPRDARSEATPPAASTAAAPAAPGSVGRKCFEFAGRRYCE